MLSHGVIWIARTTIRRAAQTCCHDFVRLKKMFYTSSMWRERRYCAVIDSKVFEDMARRLADAVPTGVKELQRDLEKNFHAILQSTFNKLDLVGREEFEVQRRVLEKTRHKLDQLEHKVAELEGRTAAGKRAPQGSRTKRSKATGTKKTN